MTVRELSEKMDAQELMEWVAYYKLQDEDELKRLTLEVESTKSIQYHADNMRNFLGALQPTKIK